MITRLKFGILEQERRYQPLLEIVLVLMLFSLQMILLSMRGKKAERCIFLLFERGNEAFYRALDRNISSKTVTCALPGGYAFS